MSIAGLVQQYDKVVVRKLTRTYPYYSSSYFSYSMDYFTINTILLRGMRLEVTNTILEAFDAYNDTSELLGALTSITNTQRLSYHRLIYNAFAEVRSHTQSYFSIDNYKGDSLCHLSIIRLT